MHKKEEKYVLLFFCADKHKSTTAGAPYIRYTQAFLTLHKIQETNPAKDNKRPSFALVLNSCSELV